jgi:hypothetical protein
MKKEELTLGRSKLGVGILQGMELPEAKLAADQILTEECERPSTKGITCHGITVFSAIASSVAIC